MLKAAASEELLRNCWVAGRPFSFSFRKRPNPIRPAVCRPPPMLPKLILFLSRTTRNCRRSVGRPGDSETAKSQPFFGRHPWVLDSAIARVEGEVSDGAASSICRAKKPASSPAALYNSRSRLRVRLYTWDPGEMLDSPFFRRRLVSAIALRKQLGYADPRCQQPDWCLAKPTD